jgi:hypothetical protein
MEMHLTVGQRVATQQAAVQMKRKNGRGRGACVANGANMAPHMMMQQKSPSM